MRTLQLRNLQTRANDDGTLTLQGLAAPYNETITYAGVAESFAPGAFDADAAVGVPLLWSHDRSETIGHITAASNGDDGLTVEAVVQPTTRGKDAQTLLRSGSLRGLSVGFDPIETKEAGGAYQYTSANLLELSLTPLPAFPSAAVTATRERKEGIVPDTQDREASDLASITSRLDQFTSRLDQFEARSLGDNDYTRKPKTISVRDAFALQIADAKGTNRLRALADVVSSGNSGVLPQDWSREVRNTIDGSRYLIPWLGRVAFPSTGYSLALPKVVNHTTVGPRGAEKSQVPSSALTTGQDFYTATWYAGGVDVALELVFQSDPSIIGIVVDDMLRQYAAVTDQAATSAFEAAATPAGSTLDTTDYGAFVAAIVTAGDQIRAATGTFGDRLALTTATWTKVIGFTDAQGRRILASGGATNSDGSAQLTAASVDVGGITVFHNPRAAEDMQFNTVSARIAEKTPVQVQSDNVALMGRDIGILGAIIDLPVYPAGIIVHSATTRSVREPETAAPTAPARKS